MDFLVVVDYINIPYLVTIVVTGYGLSSRIEGTRYDRHKVWSIFALAVVVSALFIGADLYDGAELRGIAKEYVFTYAIATSLYELIVKYVIDGVMKLFNPLKELDDDGG